MDTYASVVYIDPFGNEHTFEWTQVEYSLRELYHVDARILSKAVLMHYVDMWQKEIGSHDEKLDQCPSDKKAPSARAVWNDLWSRHVPDKTTYGEITDGRRVVQRRVFQRQDAPKWAFFECPYCVRMDTVCRNHQFELRGPHGVTRYIDQVTRTGSYTYVGYLTFRMLYVFFCCCTVSTPE